MTSRTPVTTRRVAGGLLAPGSPLLRILLPLLFALALALPLAALLAAMRAMPPELPAALEATGDERTDGERAIGYMTARLGAAPDDPKALAGLASAYLLRVRETADPTYYAKADALLQRAAARAANDPEVLVTSGGLALSRHEFARALDLGRAAVLAAPSRPAVWGVLTDALVELGRYEEAVAAAQQMVDLRPDLASLSRVSYLRELHGDLDGAIDAMRRAVAAGAPRSEATVWSEVQLGHLLFAHDDLVGAEAAYREAGLRIPGYVPAAAGLARVSAARGDLARAASLLEDAAARLPLPDIVIALGDTYARMGDDARAERQYALVAIMERLLAANGVRTDADLALFDADHDRRIDASLAALRVEYELRPSVTVADALAWAEYKSGDLATAVIRSHEALRLGTADPLRLYRAGVIAAAAGNASRSRELLDRSYAANPEFSIRYAADLARRVAR